MALSPFRTGSVCFGRSVRTLLILFAGLPLAAAAAAAPLRVDAGRMSCSSLQQTIARYGEVIVRSPSPYSGNTLSERYVAHRGFCFAGERTEQRSVVTADSRRCPVRLCVLNEYIRKRR